MDQNLLPEVRGGLFISEDQSTVGANRPFLAQLTSYDGTKFYAWTEYTYDASGNLVALDGGRSGTTTNAPAFEPNGTSITLPAYAELRRAYFDASKDWVYRITGLVGSGGSGSSLEIKDQSGTPDVTGATVLIVNAGASGFSTNALHVTNPSGSQVQVAAYYATDTQDGVVSTTTQTFAGNKTFDGSITLTTTNTVTFQGTGSQGGVAGPGAYSPGGFTVSGVFIGASTGPVQLHIGNTTSNSVAVLHGNLTACFGVGGSLGVYGTTAEGDSITGGIVTGIGASDARLKKVSGLLPPNALAAVHAVAPIFFRWDKEACEKYGVAFDQEEHFGFLAQELKAALPQTARENVVRDGEPFLSLNLPAVVAVLWQAVRELARREPVP